MAWHGMASINNNLYSNCGRLACCMVMQQCSEGSIMLVPSSQSSSSATSGRWEEINETTLHPPALSCSALHCPAPLLHLKLQYHTVFLMTGKNTQVCQHYTIGVPVRVRVRWGDPLTTVSSSVVGVKFSHQPSVSAGRPPVAVCLQGRTLSTLNIKRRMNQFVDHKTGWHFHERPITEQKR